MSQLNGEIAPNVTLELLPESDTARSQQVPQLNPEAFLQHSLFYIAITRPLVIMNTFLPRILCTNFSRLPP